MKLGRVWNPHQYRMLIINLCKMVIFVADVGLLILNSFCSMNSNFLGVLFVWFNKHSSICLQVRIYWHKPSLASTNCKLLFSTYARNIVCPLTSVKPETEICRYRTLPLPCQSLQVSDQRILWIKLQTLKHALAVSIRTKTTRMKISTRYSLYMYSVAVCIEFIEHHNDASLVIYCLWNLSLKLFSIWNGQRKK